MPADGARSLPRVALDLLTDIERAEAELLSWGVVDGSFTADELYDLAQARLIAALDVDPSEVRYSDANELLEALKHHGLLFQLPEPDAGRFRSRTAEAVRLFFRLKQLFPRHARNGAWRTAPNLVADYRLILRPRHYPKRHLLSDDVERRLAAAGAEDDLSRQVVRTLLAADSPRPWKLADFQVEAAERIWGNLAGRPKLGGTIVCAGTGSGKTLAFYLPALMLLARLAGPDRWTRCLALYPRNELLKDQLSNAIRQVRLLNQVLRTQGRSPVTVGALFGDVPRNASGSGALARSWARVGSGAGTGWACPYLTCPEPGCEHSNVVWLDSDRNRAIERLRCDREGCNFVIGPDEFVLTRSSMGERPPDLLFTGLEMVNQSMSFVSARRLLGVGVARPEHRPRLVLLDEAHTYSGTYGAQAAVLLRRWKRASRATPHFVGLSATLEDARRFFAELIDEPESRVAELAPRAADMEQEGQEVLLALRGDPVSKPSLLSTSIQAAMLLRRILDPGDTRDSLFGSKVFAFTDDLDVTNRLYHMLLDAEGWERDKRGKIRPRKGAPLASLRSHAAVEHTARLQAGQSWDLVEILGHELGEHPRVRVGRTSSQDAGVDRDAETIVATAALEVGFDDPDVGAVLQHKAPRDAASFLQRQGRAGRPRGTRPWTVVVLSDYGRDRPAYQGYEQLFSPQLRPRYLPVRNRYVLRIQAVFALMDWLTTILYEQKGEDKANLWPLLAQPPANDTYRGYNEKKLDQLAELVDKVLDGGVRERELTAYLEQALSVDSDVVQQLLWAAPRSLMLSVLPTMARRLRRRWAVAVPIGDSAKYEPHSFWSPLPEFVPSALFSDLNLPEVTVSLPPHKADDDEQMPILQALREFAPGRVSRRFGISQDDVSHWLPIPEDGETVCLVEDFCPPGNADDLGMFRYEGEHGTIEVRCLRPRRIAVALPPRDIVTTSNARLLWASQLLPHVTPVTAELPAGSPWRALVQSVSFFAHAYGNAIEVRRFALGSQYDVRRTGGDTVSGTVAFATRISMVQKPVALGYAIDSDALRITVVPLEGLYLKVQQNPALIQALRTAWFAHQVHHDTQLEGIANTFERGWLIQICLSALLLEAIETNRPLEHAAESVFGERALIPLEDVLQVIFQTLADEGMEATPDDRRIELQRLLRHAVVQDALRRASMVLWMQPDITWEPWLRERFLSTLGAAVLDACQQACPDVDAGDLCLDIDPGPRGAEEGCPPRAWEEVWLTETSAGGSGVIEAVSATYAADPRRFFHLIEAALAASDFEEVDAELGTLVGFLAPSSPIQREELVDAVREVRSARTHRETVAANEALRCHLELAGIAVTHPVAVAMHARILRPGSSEHTDELLARMVDYWRGLEEQLGVEVDARIVAYTMSADDSLDRALARIGDVPAVADRRQWRYSTLYGLLWPRGGELRSQMLSAYNPFVVLPQTDRWLALAVLPTTTTEIRIEAEDWYRRFCITLINEGAAALSAPPESRRELRRAILHILLHPLDTEMLLVQPALTGVIQEARRLRARFEVREGIQ